MLLLFISATFINNLIRIGLIRKNCFSSYDCCCCCCCHYRCSYSTKILQNNNYIFQVVDHMLFDSNNINNSNNKILSRLILEKELITKMEIVYYSFVVSIKLIKLLSCLYFESNNYLYLCVFIIPNECICVRNKRQKQFNNNKMRNL